MAHGDGILSGPIDLDGPRRPRQQHPVVAATPGLVVKQRGTPITGVVVGMANGTLIVRDRQGFEHRMTLLAGGFEVDGTVVTVVEPRAKPPTGGGRAARTASGSVAVGRSPARMACSALRLQGRLQQMVCSMSLPQPPWLLTRMHCAITTRPDARSRCCLSST